MASKRKGRRGNVTRSLEACDLDSLMVHLSHRDVELPSDIEEGNSIAAIEEIIDREADAGLEVINLIKADAQSERSGLTPLEAAVILGHYNIVKELITEGANVSYYLKDKHPLCIALENGHFDIASLLLKHDADVVNTERDGIFPMLLALRRTYCSVNIYKDFIAAGFPENGIVDQMTRETALHAAVNGGHYEVMAHILGLPSTDCNVKDRSGRTPLHYAVIKDCSVAVNMLAKHGANLNSECRHHMTPLLHAISLGLCDIVRLLIDLGVDVHFVNGNKMYSMTPLNFAAHCCQFKITQLLLDNGADVKKPVPLTGQTGLHLAAVADTLNSQANKIKLDCIIETLVKEGSELDRRNIFCFTPLHLAIKSDRSSVAKMLIQSGADIIDPVGGSRFETCLHLACEKIDRELVRMLIDYGADIYAKNEIGYPCHYAVAAKVEDKPENVQKDHLVIFKYFWAHGFPYDLTLRIKQGEPCHVHVPSKLANMVQRQKLFFTGVKTQQIKTVCKAMGQGAELNSCSVDLRYPLHYTAARGNEQILALLLYGQQNVNWLDKRCESPLHAAAKGGFVMCCRLLLEHGAVYNHCNSSYPKTPLQLARESGHNEVITLLTTVGKYFKDVRKKKFRKLRPDMRIFHAVMNCQDRNGRTLLQTAIHHNMKDSAGRLMKLRLHTNFPPQSFF